MKALIEASNSSHHLREGKIGSQGRDSRILSTIASSTMTIARTGLSTTVANRRIVTAIEDSLETRSSLPRQTIFQRVTRDRSGSIFTVVLLLLVGIVWILEQQIDYTNPDEYKENYRRNVKNVILGASSSATSVDVFSQSVDASVTAFLEIYNPEFESVFLPARYWGEILVVLPFLVLAIYISIRHHLVRDFGAVSKVRICVERFASASTAFSANSRSVQTVQESNNGRESDYGKEKEHGKFEDSIQKLKTGVHDIKSTRDLPYDERDISDLESDPDWVEDVDNLAEDDLCHNAPPSSALISVLRDGLWRRIPSNLLVEGDVFKLPSGAFIPCTCRRVRLTKTCWREVPVKRRYNNPSNSAGFTGDNGGLNPTSSVETEGLNRSKTGTTSTGGLRGRFSNLQASPAVGLKGRFSSDISNLQSASAGDHNITTEKVRALKSLVSSNKEGSHENESGVGDASSIGRILEDKNVVQGGSYRAGKLVEGTHQAAMTTAAAIETLPFDTSLVCDSISSISSQCSVEHLQESIGLVDEIDVDEIDIDEIGMNFEKYGRKAGLNDEIDIDEIGMNIEKCRSRAGKNVDEIGMNVEKYESDFCSLDNAVCEGFHYHADDFVGFGRAGSTQGSAHGGSQASMLTSVANVQPVGGSMLGSTLDSTAEESMLLGSSMLGRPGGQSGGNHQGNEDDSPEEDGIFRPGEVYKHPSYEKGVPKMSYFVAIDTPSVDMVRKFLKFSEKSYQSKKNTMFFQLLQLVCRRMSFGIFNVFLIVCVIAVTTWASLVVWDNFDDAVLDMSSVVREWQAYHGTNSSESSWKWKEFLISFNSIGRIRLELLLSPLRLCFIFGSMIPQLLYQFSDIWGNARIQSMVDIFAGESSEFRDAQDENHKQDRAQEKNAEKQDRVQQDRVPWGAQVKELLEIIQSGMEGNTNLLHTLNSTTVLSFCDREGLLTDTCRSLKEVAIFQSQEIGRDDDSPSSLNSPGGGIDNNLMDEELIGQSADQFASSGTSGPGDGRAATGDCDTPVGIMSRSGNTPGGSNDITPTNMSGRRKNRVSTGPREDFEYFVDDVVASNNLSTNVNATQSEKVDDRHTEDSKSEIPGEEGELANVSYIVVKGAYANTSGVNGACGNASGMTGNAYGRTESGNPYGTYKSSYDQSLGSYQNRYSAGNTSPYMNPYLSTEGNHRTAIKNETMATEESNLRRRKFDARWKEGEHKSDFRRKSKDTTSGLRPQIESKLTEVHRFASKDFEGNHSMEIATSHISRPEIRAPLDNKSRVPLDKNTSLVRRPSPLSEDTVNPGTNPGRPPSRHANQNSHNSADQHRPSADQHRSGPGDNQYRDQCSRPGDNWYRPIATTRSMKPGRISQTQRVLKPFVLDIQNDASYGLRFEEPAWTRFIAMLKPFGLAAGIAKHPLCLDRVPPSSVNPSMNSNPTGLAQSEDSKRKGLAGQVAGQEVNSGATLQSGGIVPGAGAMPGTLLPEVAPNLHPPLEKNHSNFKVTDALYSVKTNDGLLDCICGLTNLVGFHDDVINSFEVLKCCIQMESSRGKKKPRFVRSFDNFMSWLVRDPRDGVIQLFSKGNPVILIPKCSYYFDGTEILPLREKDKQTLYNLVNMWKSSGCRSVSYSYAPVIFNDPASKRALQSSWVSPGTVHSKCSVFFKASNASGGVLNAGGAALSGSNAAAVGLDGGCVSAGNEGIHTGNDGIHTGNDGIHTGNDRTGGNPILNCTEVPSTEAWIPQQRVNEKLPTLLGSLENNQILLGLAGLKLGASVKMSEYVASVQDAGIRCVVFSSSGDKQTRTLGSLLGMETGWNCLVSLEPQKLQEKIKRNVMGNVVLPSGIPEIKKHINEVDNVPLLVSLFSRATIKTTKQMIEILQQSGECVVIVGSALKSQNFDLFRHADASVSVLISHGHVCSKCQGRIEPELSVYQPKKCPAELQFSADLTSLPCALEANHSYKDGEQRTITVLFQAIKESRRCVDCIYQALVFYLVGVLTFGLVILITSILALPSPFDAIHLLLFLYLVLPALSFSLLANKARSNLMKEFVQKRDDKTYATMESLPFCIGFFLRQALPNAIICSVFYVLYLDYSVRENLRLLKADVVNANQHYVEGELAKAGAKQLFGDLLKEFEETVQAAESGNGSPSSSTGNGSSSSNVNAIFERVRTSTAGAAIIHRILGESCDDLYPYRSEENSYGNIYKKSTSLGMSRVSGMAVKKVEDGNDGSSSAAKDGTTDVVSKLWFTGKWSKCIRSLHNLGYSRRFEESYYHAQIVLSNQILFCLILVSLSFLERYESILVQRPRSNPLWCLFASLLFVFHILISSLAIYRTTGGSRIWPPSYWLLTAAGYGLVEVAWNERTKGAMRKHHIKRQKYLRVMFSTRLGMWSPR